MPKINNPQNFKGEELISLESITAPADEKAAGQILGSLLPNIYGYTKDGAQTVSMQAPKISFIGDCTLITDDNGNITFRIGPNLNHSQFGQADGHDEYTNQNVKTVTCSKGAQTQAIYRTGGTSTVTVDTAKNTAATIDTTTASGVIHFDTPSGFAFVVTVQKNSLKKYFVFDTTNLNLTTTSTIPR